MPLGNSITEGYTDGTLTGPEMIGYRYGLRYLLKNAGYTLDLVGSQSNGSLYFNDCQHAGIGGTRDQYLISLLTSGYDERNDIQILVPPRPYLDEFNPDIILLHIGTNDVTHEDAAALTNQKISDILDLIDEYEARANKEVIVFLALIINRVKPWGSKAQVTTNFNDGIEAIAQARISAGDKIVIVDMENDAGFAYSYDIDMANDGEGLHPNNLGYSKMASLWFSSIASNYNTAPVISNIPDQVFDEGESSESIVLDNFVEDIENADQDIAWTAQQLGTANLNITINSSRQAVATPRDNEWSGNQTVVFTATDQGMNGKYVKYDGDTVVFTVTTVNDAPVITSTPALNASVGALYSYTMTATDVDNPSVFLSYITKPEWLAFSETAGLLSGTPGQADQGDNQVILRASDGLLNTDQNFTISVDFSNAVDDAESQIFNIYPIPARNYIIVEPGELAGEILLEIFSASGLCIQKATLVAHLKSYKFDTGNLAPGVYYLRLTNKTIHHTYKFSVIK
ncbi:MAG: T9SS type A sorting domain-containing protein [Bacteroidales bacterium]|nr:T9SS type A sorting domain-containing protein [Bacteroidales bacterium]